MDATAMYGSPTVTPPAGRGVAVAANAAAAAGGAAGGAATGAAGSPPQGESDQLAASVLRSLTRSIRGQFVMEAGAALGYGLLTFGLLPLFRLRRQFRTYLALEARQIWHAAEWLRTRGGGSEAAALADCARRLSRPGRKGLWGLMTLCALASVALFVPPLGEWHGLRDVVDRTYRFLRDPSPGRDQFTLAQFLLWNAALCGGYLLHSLHLHLHVREMRALVERFNAVARREGIVPIDLPVQRMGLTIPWIIVAAMTSGLGAFWGIPMALAGAGQRRYINETSARLRAELLDRLRAMLLSRRPAVAVPNYILPDRRCGNPLCRALLRSGAGFCTRCGTPAAAAPGSAGMVRATAAV